MLVRLGAAGVEVVAGCGRWAKGGRARVLFPTACVKLGRCADAVEAKKGLGVRPIAASPAGSVGRRIGSEGRASRPTRPGAAEEPVAPEDEGAGTVAARRRIGCADAIRRSRSLTSFRCCVVRSWRVLSVPESTPGTVVACEKSSAAWR